MVFDSIFECNKLFEINFIYFQLLDGI